MKVIRITSGEYAGRYVGQPLGGGLVTNPDLQKNPPVNVPGYGLYVQPRGARQFFEGKTDNVQADLRKHGMESEVIEADVDFLRPDPATQA
jgi:hypothetical protein